MKLPTAVAGLREKGKIVPTTVLKIGFRLFQPY